MFKLTYSSGGVLNRKIYKVIGLHKGSCEKYNNGIFIKRVIDEFFNKKNVDKHNLVKKYIMFFNNCKKIIYILKYIFLLIKIVFMEFVIIIIELKSKRNLEIIQILYK